MLAQNRRVILVTFYQGSSVPQELVAEVASQGIEVHTVPLNPVVAGLTSVRTLWTELPLEVAYYTRPDFQKVVDTILRNERITDIVSFFMRTAEYVRRVKGVRKILVAEDCRVLYQSRSFESSRNLLQKAVRWWEVLKLSRYESSVVNDFDVTTLVSQHDLLAMKGRNGRAAYAVVTNGVDFNTFTYSQDQEARSGILFAGKLDVHANHIMSVQAIKKVYPIVQKLCPQSQFTIVGARPSRALVEIARKYGVAIHSNVASTIPYLHTAAVFLHPHGGGSGIQNKVLEAMACGCAVVTTPSGIQGIQAEHETHCLIGNTDQELANHVVRLLTSPDLRQSIASNARALMEREHSWQRVHMQIESVLTPASMVLEAQSA